MIAKRSFPAYAFAIRVRRGGVELAKSMQCPERMERAAVGSDLVNRRIAGEREEL